MPEVEFHFFYDRKIKAPLLEGLNVTNHTIYPQARHPWLWTIWNNYSVPIALKRVKAQLYFSPDGFLPAHANIPTLTTIHDLNFEEENSFLRMKIKHYYQKHIRQAANTANHVFTVSQFSKDDLIKRYNLDTDKISFAYNGPQKPFEDLHQKAQGIRQRYAHTHRFFLFVGAQNPRKNLQRIFTAFDAFCNQRPKDDHRLLIVGEKMLWDAEIETSWSNMIHQDRVVFSGRVPTKALNAIYSAATALVFPSVFEGFGMPIVEAFQSGCPVITSLASSMPEVAGDAALFVDPTRTEEITEHMIGLAQNEGMREELRQKGFERAKLFHWDDAAKMVEQKMRELLHA